MATIFLEGFDKYGPTSGIIETLLAQEWNLVGNIVGVVAGLSSTGRALQIGGGSAAYLGKTLPANYNRLIGGIRIKCTFNTAFHAAVVVFRDSTTSQCSIDVLTGTGQIRFFRGAYSTVMGTSSAAIKQDAIHYIEWDITFGASAPYTIYLDGLPVITGTGNTITSANPSANVFIIGDPGTGGSYVYYDDVYLFDNSGTSNNAALLTSPRIETRFPNGDQQTQFTNVGSMLGTKYYASTATAVSNRMWLRRFTSPVDQTINSVSLLPGATTSSNKFAAVIYPDVAESPTGQPLLSGGVEVVGATTNVVLTSALITPQALTAGSSYWIGILSDFTGQIQVTDTSLSGAYAAAVYTSGPPATCPAITKNAGTWNLYGNCTGSPVNWVSVDHMPPPGDSNSISSSTPGQEDLYTLTPLTPVNTAYTVAVKGNFKRNDTGSRTVDVRLRSNTTDSGGNNMGQTPATSYTWLASYFDRNPDGNVPWTPTAANAIKVGPKIAS